MVGEERAAERNHAIWLGRQEGRG